MTANTQLKTALEHLPLFRGTQPECLLLALQEAEIREFHNGETILTPTGFPHSLGIVLSGSVVAATRYSCGQTVLSVIAEGELFGAASLFGGESYVTLLTARKATAAAFLSEETIRKILSLDSQAVLNYITFLSGRIRFLNERLAILTSGSAEVRLAKNLLNLDDGSGIIPFPDGFRQLAASLGIGRASLYRALDTLTAAGALERDEKEKCIRLLDPEYLKQL